MLQRTSALRISAMSIRIALVALYVLAISASPVVVRDSVVSLPVAKRFNATGAANILGRDQTRARYFKSRGPGGTSPVQKLFSEPDTDSVVDYTVSVSILFSV